MIRRTAIGIIAILALVSACSDGETGSPSPAQSSPSDSEAVSSDAPSSPNRTLPYAGAPKVLNPLPSSVLSGDPCKDALTPEQVVQALGKEVEGQPHSLQGIGPVCGWFNPDTTGQVTVTYDVETHTGLSGEYQNVKPQDPDWKELPAIKGFPTVASAKHASSCQISVGLADDMFIAVTVALGLSKSGNADPCEVAPPVAALVVETLKKKAGA